MRTVIGRKSEGFAGDYGCKSFRVLAESGKALCAGASTEAKRERAANQGAA
jgi:hypothetical protein